MIRKYTLALAVLAFLPSAATAGPASDDPFKGLDCKKAQTQIELDDCAGKDLEAADKKLNAIYRKVLAGYDTQSQTLLKTAEKAWLSYRDSECEFETAESVGGTIHPMEGSICLTAKTDARIKELQAQIDCEEGDLTCNPPTK